MSILEAHTRPWTKFDPKNKAHRAHYAEFLRTQAWDHCPYRFFVEDEGCNLIGYIQRVLLEHYTDREFGASTGVSRTSKVERVEAPHGTHPIPKIKDPLNIKDLILEV